MEWIDGVKLTDVSAIRRLGLEPLDFISVGIECAMRQLLEHGFFHADPHPGNFFVTKKERKEKKRENEKFIYMSLSEV